MATCYRHPSRETGVSCSNCGNPICPDCMTSTSVGMRCPECARQKTQVRTLGTMAGTPTLTYGLIAVNVVVWLAMIATGSGAGGGGRVFEEGALFGPLVADGELWRLVTGGFLHDNRFPRGLLHIGFNMYLLHYLGQILEPSLGRVRFAGLYLVSLLCGSFGALLLAPDAVTVGASGAVFGLMAAAFLQERARGFDPMASGIGPLILINLALGFFIPNVSIGGHLGGLAGGAAAAWVLLRLGVHRPSLLPPLTACAGLAAVAVAGSLAVAGS